MKKSASSAKAVIDTPWANKPHVSMLTHSAYNKHLFASFFILSFSLLPRKSFPKHYIMNTRKFKTNHVFFRIFLKKTAQKNFLDG